MYAVMSCYHQMRLNLIKYSIEIEGHHLDYYTQHTQLLLAYSCLTFQSCPLIINSHIYQCSKLALYNFS